MFKSNLTNFGNYYLIFQNDIRALWTNLAFSANEWYSELNASNT